MRAKVSLSSGSSEAWEEKRRNLQRAVGNKHQTGYLSHVLKAAIVRHRGSMSKLYLWYVGNNLISHTTGIKRVLEGHSSLETLSETLLETKLCVDHQNTIPCCIQPPLLWVILLWLNLSSIDLFVVDVDSDPLAEHQVHGGRVAELHGAFDDQINAFVRRRDAVEVHRIVDGWVPGTHCRHLVDLEELCYITVAPHVWTERESVPVGWDWIYKNMNYSLVARL